MVLESVNLIYLFVATVLEQFGRVSLRLWLALRTSCFTTLTVWIRGLRTPSEKGPQLTWFLHGAELLSSSAFGESFFFYLKRP